ncbi:UNVERIFIED_CONTAM: Cyclin-C1-2 [Sesamum angustifolium]|uniref:Cyclin-C1-2 n=1 Tax=Sesamum angustifolium TaxID=2727405 RepID=A0AAW2QPU3_9LAMI
MSRSINLFWPQTIGLVEDGDCIKDWVNATERGSLFCLTPNLNTSIEVENYDELRKALFAGCWVVGVHDEFHVPCLVKHSSGFCICMAANFWTSSHFKQLMDLEEVDVVHPLDKERGITLDDFKLIKSHIANYIARLAQNVKVRQRVVATAITYMRRVYARRSMTECDPRLVAPTSLYLAAKVEESTVQARHLVFYIKKLYSDEKYRFEVRDILEMEMKILEALNYYLVVFHPYQALPQSGIKLLYANLLLNLCSKKFCNFRLLQDAGMNDAMLVTWAIVNDTYKMDLILIYPPHLVALACIYIASVQKNKENTAWFEELQVDMNVVKNMAMEILDFYDSHKLITDDSVNAAMNKLSK